MTTLRAFQIALKEKMNEIAQRDEMIEDLEGELTEKDAQIERLKTELQKYRQLAQQTNSNSHQFHMATQHKPIVVSPATAVHQRMASNGQSPMASIRSGPRHGAATLEQAATTAAVSMSPTVTTPVFHYAKVQTTKELIRDALLDNDFLRNLDLHQICEIVECMYPVEVAEGCLIIKEGEDGCLVYVMEDGLVEVTKDGLYLCTLDPGRVFGELAILYNCTRTATVKAITPCRLWAINRQTFHAIMVRTGVAKQAEYINFLRRIPIFRDLEQGDFNRLADKLDEQSYKYGEYVIRQGGVGSTFYIVTKGELRVTVAQNAGLPNKPAYEKTVRTLAVGDYFGETALKKGEEIHPANIIVSSVGATCLTLERDVYHRLFGGVNAIDKHELTDVDTTAQEDTDVSARKELAKVQLDEFDIVATLGLGGFGRVELVQWRKQQDRTFALKVMKKQHIVETKQEAHTINERNIMIEANSNFIVRLYKTYKDAKYLYMLLEPCLGGEVWSLLRDRGYFDDHEARFYAGCTMEALEYLHHRGILYRDLKPENILLDSQGYAKLVDFGFAKHVGVGRKTWTFCGTPEYVAPEIVLNKGHDIAVDYWSLGVLIFELLTGSPPFASSDPMRTYNMILRGAESIEWPRHMCKNAIALVKKLCKESPADRLGCGRGGMKDVRKARWFEAFDFEALVKRTLQPPIIPKISNACDVSNFDNFGPDTDAEPQDDTTGWDVDF